jgi:hypothetical protein
MTSDARQQLHLSQQTTELLVFTIRQIVGGFSEPREVSAVLRRVCAESGDALPEVILLRIKELWTKARQDAGGPSVELDQRYFSLISECLAIYHGREYRDVARRWGWGQRHGTDSGEPDAAAPPT